jgi:hypothetical protein
MLYTYGLVANYDGWSMPRGSKFSSCAPARVATLRRLPGPQHPAVMACSTVL